MAEYRPTSRSESDVVRFGRAIRDHWKMIVLIVVVAVTTTAVMTFRTPKQYEATADLLVTPVSSNDDTFFGINVLRESSNQSRAVLTIARLLEAPALEARVGDALQRTGLADAIDVSPLGQSEIVSITATAESPQAAAAIANGFADALVAERTKSFDADLRRQVKRLRTNLNAIPPALRASGEAVAIQQRLATLGALVGAPDPTVRVLNAAVPPTSPSWPKPALAIAVSLFASLLLGTALALALQFANPRIRREEDLIQEHRLPILTRVPRLGSSIVRGYLAGVEPLPPDAWEAYRRLRASLTSTGVSGGFPRSVLVTSAEPNDGKTMTSANLALTLASSNMRVVLIDGDLRRPSIAQFFRIPPRQRGLSGVLLGTVNPSQALVQVPSSPNLRLLLANPGSAEIVDLLNPERVARMLDDLADVADVVIIDSPPIGETADALSFGSAVENVLVAVRLGATRRARLTDLRRAFEQRGIPITGVVLTTNRAKKRSAYYETPAPAPGTVGTRQAPVRSISDEGARTSSREARRRVRATEK